QLCPCTLAITTPQTFTMASRPDDILRTGSSPPRPRRTDECAVRPSPCPPGSGLAGSLEGRADTGSSRMPRRLASRARTIWQYWYSSSLSGPLPALTPVPAIRLPSASPHCCDRRAVVVSHLHSAQQRRVAHEVGDPALIGRRRGEVPL